MHLSSKERDAINLKPWWLSLGSLGPSLLGCTLSFVLLSYVLIYFDCHVLIFKFHLCWYTELNRKIYLHNAKSAKKKKRQQIF